MRQVIQCLAVCTLALTSYLVISKCFLQSVTVVGSSMIPTLHDSQRYLLNRWVYFFHPPEHTDIVVIEDPADHGLSVKRVIAVEGDTVYLTGGFVFVNGRKLQETYLPPGVHTYASNQAKEQLFRCGKGQYFVLGDNRGNSADSRVYGPVPVGNILGQLML